MKAETLRIASGKLEDKFNAQCPTVSPEVACLKMIFPFLAEIAAQLAELNETLKNKSPLPSTEP